MNAVSRKTTPPLFLSNFHTCVENEQQVTCKDCNRCALYPVQIGETLMDIASAACVREFPTGISTLVLKRKRKTVTALGRSQSCLG
jgi:hypothetical protein